MAGVKGSVSCKQKIKQFLLTGITKIQHSYVHLRALPNKMMFNKRGQTPVKLHSVYED